MIDFASVKVSSAPTKEMVKSLVTYEDGKHFGCARKHWLPLVWRIHCAAILPRKFFCFLRRVSSVINFNINYSHKSLNNLTG